MADNEDLVSQVRIEGVQTAEAQLNELATKGGAAFDKLNKSANSAAKGVADAGQTIQKAGSQAAAGTAQFASGSARLQAFGKEIGNVKDLVSDLGQKFPQAIQALGRFSQRVATAGAAASAAGIALARAAQNVAKQYDGQSTALEDAANAQKDANNRMLEGQVAAINYDAQVRKLYQDAIQGKITWQQYSAALIQLRKDFEEQQRVAAEVRNAQDAVTEANKRLDKQLADQKATQALIDTFGGPLLSSLVNFGRTIEQISTAFKSSFGPAAASLIDLINGVVQKNFGAITSFFTSAAQKINQLISTNGPQIELFLTNIGKAAASVFDGIIAAAPAIIDFVNNQLVPAIQKVVGFLQTVADGINAIFGTRLTAGSIILIGILAQVTGSIRLLTTTVRIFGTIFKDVFKIAGGALTAFAGLFGGPLAANITRVGAAVAFATNPISLFFNLIKAGIPLLITLTEVVAVTLGVSFGAAAIAVAALAVALIFLLKNVDWKQFGQDALDAFNAIINFFPRLVATFTSIINFLQRAWAAGWQAIAETATAIGESLQAIWNAIWTTIAGYATAAWAIVQAAWQASVDFFTGIANSIQEAFNSAWEFLKSGFQSAFNTVVGYAVAFVAAIKAYLQPLIDLITAIVGSLSQANGAASGGAVTAATGGEITGPGSGTSDSIPAWLSNGEFVQKASAVRKYGTGFMHALNQGRVSMMRFAEGGIAGLGVSAPSVGYALGTGDGAPKGMSPLNLSLFGETFENLLMPEDVAGRLTRYAVAKQTRSAGRKPSWVGRSRN